MEEEDKTLSFLDGLYKECIGAVQSLDQKLHDYKVLYDQKVAEI